MKPRQAAICAAVLVGIVAVVVMSRGNQSAIPPRQADAAYVGAVPDLRYGGFIRLGGSGLYKPPNNVGGAYVNWGPIDTECLADYKSLITPGDPKGATLLDRSRAIGPYELEVTTADGYVYRSEGKRFFLLDRRDRPEFRAHMGKDDFWGQHLKPAHCKRPFEEKTPLKHVILIVGEKYIFEWTQGEPWFWPKPKRK